MIDAQRGPTAFDGAALVRAVDARRDAAGLHWAGVAEALTRQSEELRAATGDHAVCSGALVRTVRRGTMSCQYALMLLRWLDRVPEAFLVDGTDEVLAARLPAAGPHQRLRWDLGALHGELDAARRSSSLTWQALGDRLDCTPNRLTNLRTAREADMDLVMRVVRWLNRPSTAFIRAEQ